MPEHEGPFKAHLEKLPVAWCPRASPSAVLHQALSFSPHVKLVGIMRVCGYLTALFRKLSLSCVCRKVVPNSTSLRITATHEENATVGSGAFSIGSKIFPHCIALASMQLIDMQHHTSGIILTLVLRGLLSPDRRILWINVSPWEKSHRRRIRQ